jgi:hypothetical protein
MVARAGDPGFVVGRTSLVPHNGVRLPATITAKRPIEGSGQNMANWVVFNAAPHGVLANADFYKYLEHAEGADLKGTGLKRQFTIEEVRKGWWKQTKVTVQTNTVLPDHLLFRLPDNSGQGA